MLHTSVPEHHSHSDVLSKLNILSNAVHQANSDEALFSSAPAVWAKRLVAPLTSMLIAGLVGYGSLVIGAMTAGLSILAMSSAATAVYVGVSLVMRSVTTSPTGRLLKSIVELDDMVELDMVELDMVELDMVELDMVELDMVKLEKFCSSSANAFNAGKSSEQEQLQALNKRLLEELRQVRADHREEQVRNNELDSQLKEARNSAGIHQGRNAGLKAQQQTAELQKLKRRVQSAYVGGEQKNEKSVQAVPGCKDVEVQVQGAIKSVAHAGFQTDQGVVDPINAINAINAKVEKHSLLPADCGNKVKTERIQISGGKDRKDRQVLDESLRPVRQEWAWPKPTTSNLTPQSRDDLEYRWVSGDCIADKLKLSLDRASKQQNSQKSRLNPEDKQRLEARLAELFKMSADPEWGSVPLLTKFDDRSGAKEAIVVNFSTSPSGVAIASSKGMQDYMEDVSINSTFTVTLPGNQSQAVHVTGVFDGHSGESWAQYASANFVDCLKSRLESFSAEALNDESIFNALKITFVDLVVKSKAAGGDGLSKGGTTANIALRINNGLWVANVGDSRAILLNGEGKAEQLSEDAQPCLDHYKNSITKRGGEVVDVGKKKGGYRVNGKLACGRSVGDIKFGVSPRPKLSCIQPESDGRQWLIQVTDGITGALNTDEIVSYVAEQLAAGNSPAFTAGKLVGMAIRNKSKDNLMAIIRPL